MAVVQVENNVVRWVTPYTSLESAPPFDSSIILMEAPDNVHEGWGYNAETGEFIPPKQGAKLTPVIPERTNTEVIQGINDLKADLIIAGVIQV